MKTCDCCLDDEMHALGYYINSTVEKCNGCIIHSEKSIMDKDELYALLQERIENKLNKFKSLKYDCLIPISGDAEDFYVVKKIIDLKLNPLVLFINNYFGTDITWQNVHKLITEFDVDSIVYNPNFANYQELVRSSLRKYTSIYWPYQALKTSYPIHIALEYKIPFIFFGQSQPIEQVGKFSHFDRIEMSKWSRLEHDLFGVDEESFAGTGLHLQKRQYSEYFYPNIEVSGKIEGIYLSNYVPWDPWLQNNSMIDLGYLPCSTNGTFDQYERVSSSVYFQLHDLLRLRNQGYVKARDHLSRECRHNRISRKNAEDLYFKYKNRSFFIKPFFDWLDVTSSGYSWFVQNKLGKYQSKICDSLSEYQEFDPSLYFDNTDFFTDGQIPQREFVTIAKGI